MTTIVIVITERPDKSGIFDARVEGRHQVLCSSRQPFFDSARKLAKIALSDPAVILAMKHEGSDDIALHGRLASAALYSVVERNRGMIAMERWMPSQMAAGLE
jgi:hypothetical protein